MNIDIKLLPKALIKAALFITLCCATIALLSVKAHAATKEWDGKTAMKAGNTYIITREIALRKEFVVPVGAKLSVKDGGTLKIYSSGGLTVRGELAVAVGGYLKNSGSIFIKKGGNFNIYGQAQSSVSGTLDVSGNMTVFNAGSLEVSSVTKIYKGAQVLNKGLLYFYKSSDVKHSGTIRTSERSDLQLRGIMNVSVSGVIEINGHLTVGAKSNVRCSGTLILTESSSYTRFKTITITSNGKFVDSRPAFKYEEMTIDVLIDEKKIKRKGIDVSYAQGDIDWKKVADSGVEFAIIRAGRGNASPTKPMKEDDYFRQNITEAQKYGIDVGVYFYSYATSVAEAREEAEFFVTLLDGYKIQYPVILDMEEEFQGKIGKKKLTNMIEAFFEVLMENRYYPMFYSYKSWIETYLDMTVLDKYSLWLAQVNDVVTYDGGYYIWQYSFTGKVSGIKGGVDLDYSYRDFESIFKKYHLNNY